MESLLLLLLVPIGWPFIAKAVWGHEYTFQELALNIVVACVIASGVWYAGRYVQMRDVEIINGAVIGKSRETVSCSHSYSCRCTTNSKGQKSCSTCYRHSNDYDWVLRTNVGPNIEVSRVDSQGSTEPGRYRRAQVGDPVAVENAYENYVKASAGSLFHDKGSVLTNLPVPAYPNTVFDYHYVNRALAVGVTVPDLAQWNLDIANALRQLGPSKQVNFVVVFAGTSQTSYAQALEREWVGGKKNDVIVVLGTPKYPELSWVRVLSWTDREKFKVGLRDELLDMKVVDRSAVMAALTTATAASYQRKSMKDFEYLKYDIEPPVWVLILAFVLSAGTSVGLSRYFSKHDVTFAGVLAVLIGAGTAALVFRRRK